VAVSNQPAQLDDLKRELDNMYAVSVHTLNMDLARESAAKEIFDRCEADHLGVEVLVNNAGILVTGDAVEVEYARAADILQLHMNTPALLCHLFGKKMTARKKGYILNVSSISAVMPYPVISFYGPSKTFIRYFTRALRTEMKDSGIRVTCLLPGATATGLYDTHNINIPLAMKLGVMKKPESVARAGVKALFAGRAECIPGTLNKLLVFMLPLVPVFVIARINRLRNVKKSLQ